MAYHDFADGFVVILSKYLTFMGYEYRYSTINRMVWYQKLNE